MCVNIGVGELRKLRAVSTKPSLILQMKVV